MTEIEEYEHLSRLVKTPAFEAIKQARDEDLTLAANGAMFSKDKQGIIPRLMQELKDSRSLSKKQMLEAKQSYIDTKDESFKKTSVIKGTSQLAVKV